MLNRPKDQGFKHEWRQKIRRICSVEFRNKYIKINETCYKANGITLEIRYHL